MEYCETLAREGGAIVARLLGTEIMDNAEGTLTQCFFSNVRLPLHAEQFTLPERNQITQWITSRLVFDHHTFLAIHYHADAWWVRLSAQVYLELQDFDWAARTLDKLCKQVADRKFLETIPIADVKE